MTIETHPSYGMILFSRVSGAGRLFGSPLSQHFGTIRIRIQHGEREHDDGDDTYRVASGNRRAIVEIELSAAQFAEAITTMNFGDGVPCTIRRIGNEGMPDVPDTESNEAERSADSFKERVSTFVAAVKKKHDEIDRLLDKERLTKEDRAKIRELTALVLREATDVAPFLVEQFVEVTERVATKAKSEIVAMADHVARMLGVDAAKRLSETRANILEERND